MPDHIATSELAEPFEDGSFVGSVILPSGTALLNGVSANFGLDVLFWRPGRRLRTQRRPVLVCACEHDSVAPATPTIAYAKEAPSCELRVYPYRHFEIYVGQPFEEVLRDQLAFLTRLGLTRSLRGALAEDGVDGV